MQPSNEMLERLRKLAARETYTDDYVKAELAGQDAPCIVDYSGSNVDDAYAKGERDGETELARAILEDLARGE